MVTTCSDNVISVSVRQPIDNGMQFLIPLCYGEWFVYILHFLSFEYTEGVELLFT